MSIPPARNWHSKPREAQFGVAVSTPLLNSSLDVAVVRQQLFNMRDTIIFTKEPKKNGKRDGSTLTMYTLLSIKRLLQ